MNNEFIILSYVWQSQVASFKRNQDEAEMKELRRNGIVLDIPAEYGVLLPMISLAEVAVFAANLHQNTLVSPEGLLRNRRMEFVSFN